MVDVTGRGWNIEKLQMMDIYSYILNDYFNTSKLVLMRSLITKSFSKYQTQNCVFPRLLITTFTASFKWGMNICIYEMNHFKLENLVFSKEKIVLLFMNLFLWELGLSGCCSSIFGHWELNIQNYGSEILNDNFHFRFKCFRSDW